MKDSTRFIDCRPRLAVTVLVALLTIFAAETYAADPYILFRPSPGNCCQLYFAGTGGRIALPGTEKMTGIVIGDLDGDGLENEIVYRDATSGGLRWYKIPQDAKWRTQNDHAVPNTPSDAVPQAVVRLGGAGTLGAILFSSAAYGQTCAIRSDGWGITGLGRMDRVVAADVRQLGYKMDLVWWTDGVGTRWRAGVTGSDYPAPASNLVPIGGACIVPNQPDRPIVVFPTGGDAMRAYDRYWKETRIEGTAWPWCATIGSTALGDITGDGIAEVLFVAGPTDPLQCYQVPTNGSPWNQGGLSSDPNMRIGQNLYGVVTADVAAPATISQSQISALRSLPDGTTISMSAKPRTRLVKEKDPVLGIVTTGYYIQEAARSSGIRVMGTTSAPEGRLVSVRGTLHTINGERVILSTGETVSAQTQTVTPLGTTVKSIYGTLAMTGLLVRVAGTITSANVAAGWFTLSDGYSKALKVYCPDSTRTSGSVNVTGCVGAEKNASGQVVPVLRVESASRDITGGGSAPPSTPTANYFIWTESSLKKVAKTDPAQTLQPVSIRAARNEHEAFQIVLRGDQTAIKAVTVTPSDLKSATGLIAASNVKVHLPYYINLPHYSRYVADPLPLYKGPFDLQAGQTQPLWIDVYVPKTAPSGDYTGSISIASTNGKTFDVAYTLKVYNFTLPDESKLTTQFDFYDYYMAPKEGVTYGSAACRTLWKQYYEFLLERGISTAAFPVDDFMSAEAAAYMKDPRLTSFRIPESNNATVQKRYFDQIKANGAWGKGFCVMPDEVYDKTSYDLAKSKAAFYRSIDPTAPTITTYYTATPPWAAPQHTTDILAGYISIWCPISGHAFEEDRLAVRRALGEKVWTYVCTNPDGVTPNFFLQDPAMSHRIIAWQCYFHQASGWLYWHSNYWADVSDPWTDICTGKVIDPRLYGEGSILYPGKVHTGVAGPVSSIRLEVFRDSLEDYKYLWLLEQKIGRAGVMTYVKQLITDWWHYNQSPATFESVRDQIARRIES
jgi:hypothetical protein